MAAYGAQPFNTKRGAQKNRMLRFDNASITLTTDKTIVIQLYVRGSKSGYPAETSYTSARRLFQDLGDALAEHERREREGPANVIDFKQHG